MSPLIRFFRNLGLSLLALLALDLALGHFVSSTYRLDGNALERYLGYGFSIQSKLNWIVGADDSSAHSLAMAGWNPSLPGRQMARDLDCQKRYTFYGMSFSSRIAEALFEEDPCVSIRLIAGPGAPLSHSYSEYLRFHTEDDAEVVVLGVLASSLPKNLTTAHFNSAFEAPGSHMYPRFRLVDGELKAIKPPANNLQEFRDLLRSDIGYLQDFMSKQDEYYNPLIFGYPQLDKSVVARMLRRAYGQSYKRNLVSQYRTADGLFTNLNELRDLSLAMLVSAARIAEQDGVRFIVVLINDQGYAESLDEVLAQELASRHIPFVSSTSVIDSRDASSFLSDGHFKPELDKKLAQALRERLAP